MLRSASIAIAVCGLVACSLGPHYKRPDIPPPDAWRDPHQQIEAEWPSSDWWKSFNSPTLNDLMTQAQAANDDIAAAIARIRISPEGQEGLHAFLEKRKPKWQKSS